MNSLSILDIKEIKEMLERSAKKKLGEKDLSYDEYQEYLLDIEYQYEKLSQKYEIKPKID